MTRLSSGVLCSKWLSLPKRFFGVFPKQFFTLVSQSPAVFWADGCCFRKGSVEGSANCALHLSPSLLLGWKLRELLTCLTHTNPVRRKRPIMSLLLGYSLGLLFTPTYLGKQFSLNTPRFQNVSNVKNGTKMNQVIVDQYFSLLSLIICQYLSLLSLIICHSL